MKKILIFCFIYLVTLLVLIFIKFFPDSPRISKKPKNNIPISLFHPPALPTATSTPAYQAHSPSLEKIFLPDHSWTASLSAEKVRTIMVTGDVMLGRHVTTQMTKRQNFLWPWEKTAILLKSTDLTIINLENPVFPGCPPRDEGMVFCASEKTLPGLKLADIDLASLANNHSRNYGEKGIGETVKILNESDIALFGTGSAVFREINGLRFAFLGYNDVGALPLHPESANPDKIMADIKEAKSQADLVVPFFHWGEEYSHHPNQRPKMLAHLAVDAGADLVLGNHPHWVQAVEKYNDKYIAYSHGNFIFDQMWSSETREGVVGRYTFYDQTLVDIEFIPILISDFGQPDLAPPATSQKIFTDIQTASRKLQ